MEKLIHLIASDKVVNNMKKLYPKWEVSKRLRRFYTEKIKLCFVILVLGIILSLIIRFCNKNQLIDEAGRIARNGYGEGTKKVIVSMNRDDEGGAEDVEIEISEKRYTDAEIINLSEEFFDELEKKILFGNKSLDYVTNDLNFVKKIDGYPFTVSYRTDKPLLLSRDGKIDDEKLCELISDQKDDGILVCVTATATYFDFKEDRIFYACLYEKPLSEQEKFYKNLDDFLKAENEKSINTDYYNLPNSIGNKRVRFSEKTENTYMIVAMLFLIATVLIYVMKDKEIEKETEKRQEELIREYPRLVNKFTLFYNAGMPVKKIWMKLCDEYLAVDKRSKEKNYLYEEMLITRAQMLDGKRDVDAYEEFAKRINIPRYRVFVSLLEQAVNMGRSDLNISLRRESDDAFIERKNNAKKLFEEAGTKLLIPMFMMLMVIMVIIIFPAFYSFNM